MAAGDVTQIGASYHVSLLVAAAAANGKPAGANAGVALSVLDSLIGAQRPIPEAELRAWSSAGAGVLDANLRGWGYDPTAAKWFPMGTGMDDLKGQLNDGNTIGESDTDQIVHSEIVRGVRRYSRVYIEVVSVNNATMNAALIVPMHLGV
jgi:hypothetical protein